MEYVIGIAAIVILGYLAFRMNKSSVDESKVELVTPTPIVEVPASTPVVEAPTPVVEAPAKKPRKPRVPKVEQVPVKAKAPVAKTAAIKAKLKKA